MPLGRDEINERFGFHKATLEGPKATAPKHRDLRLQFIEFAGMLDALIPDGRHKDIVFIELEDASMWAHKGIAQGDELVLDCEQSSIHCNGPVRQWFIYPDNKTPHAFCKYHHSNSLSDLQSLAQSPPLMGETQQ